MTDRDHIDVSYSARTFREAFARGSRIRRTLSDEFEAEISWGNVFAGEREGRVYVTLEQGVGDISKKVMDRLKKLSYVKGVDYVEAQQGAMV